MRPRGGGHRPRSPAGHPARSAGGGRGNSRKKEKEKEEKWCLLSRWCCQEGKEGHGQPGAVGGQRPGTAGAAEGRGRLPSPRAAFPAPGKRSRSLGMREQERHHPRDARGHGPGPKAAVAAPAQRSCLVPAGRAESPGMERGTKTRPGDARWAVRAVRAARRHGSRKRHRGPAQCNK